MLTEFTAIRGSLEKLLHRRGRRLQKLRRTWSRIFEDLQILKVIICKLDLMLHTLVNIILTKCHSFIVYKATMTVTGA